MGMTYCSCKQCGEDMRLDNFELYRFGKLCEECRTKADEQDAQER